VVCTYNVENERLRPIDERAFLKGLIEGMRCGIVSVDRGGRLLLLNEPAAQILEIEDRSGRGTTAEAVFGRHPQVLRVLNESFAMSALPSRAELELTTAAGDARTVGFTLSHVLDDDGQPAAAAMFFKDLTQIEQREEQARLKDRLAALGEMAASMAHEIRNPLAAIDVTCSLVRRRLNRDERGRELLDKVTREIHRLNQAISSSLEFVRPVSINLARAELPPLLRAAIGVARERVASADVTLDAQIDETIEPFLMDSSQLRQVFENLLVNAIEAVGASGRVRVEAERIKAPAVGSIPYAPEGGTRDPWLSAKHCVMVRVMDSGPGVPEEVRDRIFYPFFTTKRGGSGVGLSTVKKIVDQHRGLIDVDAAPLGGARFSVRLPVVQPED